MPASCVEVTTPRACFHPDSSVPVFQTCLETPPDFSQQLHPILCIDISSTGFGGLGVMCWPLLPKFAGSIFRSKKSSARLPSERK